MKQNFLKLSLFLASFLLIGLSSQSSLSQSEDLKTGADVISAYSAGNLDFSYWNLVGADLRFSAFFSREGVNLTGANFYMANLTDADLEYANLTDAYLEGANLTRADLKWTNLTDAYLEGANLTGAILREANLEGAILREADLIGADFRWANLTEADFTGARYNKETKFPEGFDPESEGMILVE